MATVKPFRGIRYNQSLVKDPGAVITPPYDVIDNKEQALLHEKSPYNIIRLEYGKEYPDDDKTENRYSRAEKTLNIWLEEGVLQVEEQPCFYLYEQSFKYQGQDYTRRGLMAALKLEDYANKVVLPHELTMSGPKIDRLSLLKRVKTNISPIFNLFPDPEQRFGSFFYHLNDQEPHINATESSGQNHRIWLVKDRNLQNDIAAYLSPQPLLIADGHHRYETALEYSGSLKGGHTDGAAYILSVLVSMHDPGLLVLSTHRLLHNLGVTEKSLLHKFIEANFKRLAIGYPEQLSEKNTLEELEKNDRANSFVFLDRDQAWLLKPLETSAAQSLAVVLLHELILKPLLQSGEGLQSDSGKLSFSHDLSFVRDQVRSGEADAAFLLAPISIQKVLDYSLKGSVMPQKSTYFYPKLPSGLVLRHLDLS
jgi:uncharacterized protein (DUF1015 family)